MVSLVHSPPASVWSEEIALAAAPARTYERLGADPDHGSWMAVVKRVAVVVLLLGVLVPIAAAGRVTVGLVVLSTISWAFVAALQAIVGLGLIAAGRRRRVTWARALDLYFAAHAPWSLWLAIVAVVIASETDAVSARTVLLSVGAPVAWTAILLAAFCRTVLGTSRGAARLLVAAHQAATWSIVLSYIAWSAGGWFRLLGP